MTCCRSNTPRSSPHGCCEGLGPGRQTSPTQYSSAGPRPRAIAPCRSAYDPVEEAVCGASGSIVLHLKRFTGSIEWHAGCIRENVANAFRVLCSFLQHLKRSKDQLNRGNFTNKFEGRGGTRSWSGMEAECSHLQSASCSCQREREVF